MHPLRKEGCDEKRGVPQVPVQSDCGEVEGEEEMTLNELKRRFPGASPDFYKKNSDSNDLGSVPASVTQRSGRRKSEATNADQARSTLRVVISLLGFRRTPLDDDNFVSACKHIRDGIAETIGCDDGDKRLRWQYQQIQTCGEEGLLVRIELQNRDRD